MRQLNRATTLQIATALVLLSAYALFPETAFANILTEAENKLQSVWDTFRKVIYVLAAIGLGVGAIAAFFGKWKWGHFLALAGGVFLVAFFDQLVQFLGGSSSGDLWTDF